MTTATKTAPATVSAKSNGLSGNEIKTLQALAKSKTALTRNDLRAATGIQKGWSGMLGASTKTVADDTLCGRGYVKDVTDSHPKEGGRSLLYTITANGRKALEKALKTAKE